MPSFQLFEVTSSTKHIQYIYDLSTTVLVWGVT